MGRSSLEPWTRPGQVSYGNLCVKVTGYAINLSYVALISNGHTHWKYFVLSFHGRYTVKLFTACFEQSFTRKFVIRLSIHTRGHAPSCLICRCSILLIYCSGILKCIDAYLHLKWHWRPYSWGNVWPVADRHMRYHSATVLVTESDLCLFSAGSSRRSSGHLSGDAGSVNIKIRSGGLEGPCDDHCSLQSRTASQQPASSGHSTTMQRLVIQRRFFPYTMQMNESLLSYLGCRCDPTMLGDIYRTKYLINEWMNDWINKYTNRIEWINKYSEINRIRRASRICDVC